MLNCLLKNNLIIIVLIGDNRMPLKYTSIMEIINSISNKTCFISTDITGSSLYKATKKLILMSDPLHWYLFCFYVPSVTLVKMSCLIFKSESGTSFRTDTIIIISLLMCPLVGHRPSFTYIRRFMPMKQTVGTESARL
jgi:hypothetical protein